MHAMGLLVMDVDSTLIREEVIDLLGEEAGVGLAIAEKTWCAMCGELDFGQALQERVSLLKGLPLSAFDKVASKVHLTAGAEKLVEILHARGYKIGVVSGGFHEIVDSIAQRLDLDFVRANQLEVENECLTGRIKGEIVTKEVKKSCLKEWASECQLPLSKTIAVGDGANDLAMIQTAGVGIAFCAKPIVYKQAPYRIDEPNLYSVVTLLESLSWDVAE